MFTWEFNPATLLAITLAVVAGLKGWWDAKDKANEACRIANEALREAKRAQDQIILLQGAFATYREIQAERVVSREVLREVENRMAKSIDGLGDRLDAIIQKLWNQPRPPGLP